MISNNSKLSQLDKCVYAIKLSYLDFLRNHFSKNGIELKFKARSKFLVFKFRLNDWNWNFDDLYFFYLLIISNIMKVSKAWNSKILFSDFFKICFFKFSSKSLNGNFDVIKYQVLHIRFDWLTSIEIDFEHISNISFFFNENWKINVVRNWIFKLTWNFQNHLFEASSNVWSPIEVNWNIILIQCFKQFGLKAIFQIFSQILI